MNYAIDSIYNTGQELIAFLKKDRSNEGESTYLGKLFTVSGTRRQHLEQGSSDIESNNESLYTKPVDDGYEGDQS
jgi:hypothetical protein